MRELYWKDSYNVTCPHCMKEDLHTVYLNVDSIICDHCGKEFEVQFFVENITLKATNPPAPKVWEVWSEGYAATGQSSGATFHGSFPGATFHDALKAYKATLTNEISRRCCHIDDNPPNFWGCRFFDNERDARKSFG